MSLDHFLHLANANVKGFFFLQLCVMTVKHYSVLNPFKCTKNSEGEMQNFELDEFRQQNFSFFFFLCAFMKNTKATHHD